jgi:hypothetical protein
MQRGKLFHVEQSAQPRSMMVRKHQTLPRMEYFWLCDDCAPFFTIAFAENQGIIVSPLRPKLQQRVESVQPISGIAGIAAGGSTCTTS